MIEVSGSDSVLLRRSFAAVLLVMLFVAPAAVADGSDGRGGGAVVDNPGAELWREVRQRDGAVEGRTQVGGVDAGSLINVEGEAWRQLRVEKIIPYSAYVLAAALLGLAGFRLIRGKVRIEAGRSGKRILRFSLNHRVVHWIVAILFVILAISGAVLLLGRMLVIPLIGNEAFHPIASLSKTLHNYCGPVFAVALLAMLVAFIKGNAFRLKDISWFMSGGGMFGKHASSGRYNAGEKAWFWLAMLSGAVVVGSGLVLNFPIFEQTRQTLQLTQIIHVISAVVMLVGSFGHIYMGTVAMEGAFETMSTGYCDSNWAKEHHDEWYEEVKDSAEVIPPDARSTPGATAGDAPSPGPAS